MQYWLLTAFEPFAGRKINSSEETLKELKVLSLENEKTKELSLQTFFKVLPVEYDRCFEVLNSEVSALRKQGVQLDGILSLGEGAEDFKIETQAHNLDDVERFPDNAGTIRVAKKIFPKLKDETFPLDFPYDAFYKIRKSVHAGSFVCNNLCAHASCEYTSPNDPYFGFVHIPQVGKGGAFEPKLCAEIIWIGFSKLLK